MLNTAIIGFCLYLITLSFAWLLLETNFLRVRLPCGRANKTPEIVEWINAGCPKVIEQIPEPAKREYFNPCANLLPERCTLTIGQEIMGKYASRHGYSSGGYNVGHKDSYQQFAIGNQTITLLATLPNLYEIWDDVIKAQSVKQSGGFAESSTKQPSYKNSNDGWIEISCNGQSLKFTTDSRPGDIKRFMGKFTARVRVGKRMETVFEGYKILDCGGGVKIVTYPDQMPDALDKAIDSLARERVAEAVND